MCEDIFADVADCRVAGQPGSLAGYRRLCVKGEPYPGLVPVAGHRVEGVLYREMPAAAWARLDRFEGEMYHRRRVRVELGGGAVMAAETYLVKAAFSDCLESSEWDFDAFLRNGKALFQARYNGYQTI